MIVGKAGRADTPTDPSPLDMVESVITLRPKEQWPKRKLDYKDAQKQMAVVLAALQKRHLIEPIQEESQRHAIMDPATMNAAMRGSTRRCARWCSNGSAGSMPNSAQSCCGSSSSELVGRWQKAGRLREAVSDADIDRLTAQLRRSMRPSSPPVPARRTSTG